MLFLIIWVFRDKSTLGLFSTGFFVYIIILRVVIAVSFMFGVLYPAFITLLNAFNYLDQDIGCISTLLKPTVI